MPLAFAHINLRRNPFGELTEAERAALAVVDIDDEVAWLQTPRRAVQIIGASGNGKTTHLLAFRARLSAAALVRVRADEPTSIPADGDPLLIDEVQFLEPGLRRRLWTRPVAFVLGTHDDLSAELIASGLSVRTLWPAERMTTDRLHRALSARVEAARRGPGRIPEIEPSLVADLRSRFGADVRSMEDFLYERFQRLPEVR